MDKSWQNNRPDDWEKIKATALLVPAFLNLTSYDEADGCIEEVADLLLEALRRDGHCDMLTPTDGKFGEGVFRWK